MKTIHNLRDLVSLVCVPLLVIVLAMWVRSYFVLDRLSFRDYDGMDVRLRSDLGRVTYFETTAIFPRQHPKTELHALPLPEQDLLLQFWESLGFQHEFMIIGEVRKGEPITRSLTKVPYWFLFGVLAFAPGWRYAGWRRSRIRVSLPPVGMATPEMGAVVA